MTQHNYRSLSYWQQILIADATKSVLTGPLNFQEPQEDITVPKYT